MRMKPRSAAGVFDVCLMCFPCSISEFAVHKLWYKYYRCQNKMCEQSLLKQLKYLFILGCIKMLKGDNLFKTAPIVRLIF